MRSNNLKAHMKTRNATKSKVFMTSCNICEKLMRKTHLKRHLKTHKSILKDVPQKTHSSEQDITPYRRS